MKTSKMKMNKIRVAKNKILPISPFIYHNLVSHYCKSNTYHYKNRIIGYGIRNIKHGFSLKIIHK